MNYEEYLEKTKQLQYDLDQKKTELMKEFVRANNPYKKGDVITDHVGTILVETMGFAWGYLGSQPCATYTGLELKKDGTPNKKGNKRTVWQSNIIKQETKLNL